MFLRGVGEPDEMLRLPHSGDQLGVDQCVGLAMHQAAHDENADLRAESAEGYAFFDGGDAEPFCAGLNQPGSAGGKAMSVGICFDDGQQIGGCGVVQAPRFVASLAGSNDRRYLKLAMSREREISTLVTGDVSIFALIRIFKSRVLGHIHQMNDAGGAIALLGDNDFRLIF